MKISRIAVAALFASMWVLPTIHGRQSGAAARTLNPGDPGYKMPSGVAVVAELTRAMDAKKIAVGEEVQAKVEQEMRYDGKVVVPLESKILGHVREVKVSGKDDPETRLRIEFEKIVLKSGGEISFEYPAFVAALAPDRREAIAKSNLNDLPVKPEMGTAIDRVDANPNIKGAQSNMIAGLLSSAARGVIVLKGLELVDGPHGPVIVAKKGNIKLEYGTQMVLIVATPARK